MSKAVVDETVKGCGWPDEHCDFCESAEEYLAECEAEEERQRELAARTVAPELPRKAFVPLDELDRWRAQRNV